MKSFHIRKLSDCFVWSYQAS